uniref:NADH dehydrogenase subunit 6 n=1 Tax=Glaucosphaera vacuolata TaxID=38265 RepID=UPI001FCDD1A1|nr:NADH dehydrogenase subunit 6 [Glaucosphaera vacuolata]UNJ18775.1 NADH dehydrogenase subunit 6 [Glaucosphaera vacuolata]
MNLEFLFYLFSSFLIVSAWMVVGSVNTVHSVLFLILVFLNAASLLFLIGAEFIAIMFIVIYVGAIAVLFLFIVMMLNIKVNILEEFYIKPVSVFIVLLFLFQFLLIANLDLISYFDFFSFLQNYFDAGFVLSNLKMDWFNWVLQQNEVTNIFSIGFVLYTFYGYLLVLSGLVLLVSMLGTIFLTLHQRPVVKKQAISLQNLRKSEVAVRFVKIT